MIKVAFKSIEIKERSQLVSHLKRKGAPILTLYQKEH